MGQAQTQMYGLGLSHISRLGYTILTRKTQDFTPFINQSLGYMDIQVWT